MLKFILFAEGLLHVRRPLTERSKPKLIRRKRARSLRCWHVGRYRWKACRAVCRCQPELWSPSKHRLLWEVHYWRLTYLFAKFTFLTFTREKGSAKNLIFRVLPLASFRAWVHRVTSSHWVRQLNTSNQTEYYWILKTRGNKLMDIRKVKKTHGTARAVWHGRNRD